MLLFFCIMVVLGGHAISKKRNQLHKNVLGNHGCFACILEIYTIAKFEAIDGFTLMIFSNDLLASLVTINSKHLFT